MEKSIKIISSTSRFCEVEAFLNSIFSEYQFSRKLYCRIYVAVTEAVNNAIQHGNNFDPQKYVGLSFSEINNTYQILIEDEGDGFDYKNLADPTLSENIAKESGRGIFFMNKYADDVIFLNNGSTVKLNFYKTSD
jgi:serine/threonine-protein kinase RsbW